MPKDSGEDESMAESQPPEESQKTPEKISQLPVLFSLINLIVTLAIGIALFLAHQKEKGKVRLSDINPNATESENSDKKEGEQEGAKHGEKKGEAKGAAGSGKDNKFSKMINLETFTVNLSTPGSGTPKFVRTHISLEIASEETEGEINAKIPQIRNVIIDLCNSKRAADLVTVEGREYLKEEIKNSINHFLVTGKLKGVYFTSFALSG